MRRNLQRLMVAIAAMMICLGASAIDKVVKKATLTGEVTSLDALKEATFLLADESGTEVVVMYTPSGWDIKVASASTALANLTNGGFYKLEAVESNFLMPVFNFDKSVRTYWAGNQYVNSQPKGGNVIFGLSGASPNYGQDGKNLALWTITYAEGKGFAFKCFGREDADIYIGHDAEAARPVAVAEGGEIPYWKAYTAFETGYVAADVEAAGTAVAAALKASDAKSTFDAAKLAYEADKTAEGALDKYAAAINAAVDVINLCEKVNKQYADYKLSTNGAAAVKDVLAKYNAGEYKDAAALNAAYVEAAKAQNCDGADMTGAIFNPSFELGTKEGWTSENCGDVATNYNFGGRTGDKFCERWTNSANGGKLNDGKFYQALTGLPNGTYKVTADMQNREQGNGDAPGTGFFVFANEDKTEGLDAKDGKTFAVTTEVADGNLTLGVQLSGCSGNWVCFDNFTLTLVKAANATVPEKDAWYTGADFFRFRADKNAAADSPYAAYKDKVEPAWGAAAGEETNGCIVCKVPANVNPASQIWIRGTEAGQTVANGSKEGFKVTFRVKADGEYTLESQAHNNWGYKTGGNPFGPLNVTTEWQTVSFVCTGEKAKADFTDLCFNLSGDAERTFYFDDVQIARGSEWYLNNEFRAKDYKKENPDDPDPVYKDGNDPYPAARFVSDAEGGYVEVISNAGASQTYNSQLWIAIPQEFVGTMTKMTIEVQASKAITCPESFQATATGNGWGCNPGPGKGVEFKVGEWTTIERVLNTKNVKSTGTWKDLQADQYCLDLSDVSDAKEAVTYKFRGLKFEQAQEDWYTENPIYAKNFSKGTETYDNGTDFPKVPYVYGNGEEGGYAEVVSNKEAANDYDSQIFFEIPEALRGKSVQISMKAKASKEITVPAQLHSNANGTGWGPAAAGDQVTFTVGEWTEIKRTFNSDAKDQNGNAVAYYVLNLSEKGGAAITYDFDEVAFDEFIDWGELEEVPVEGTLVQTQDWTAQTSYSGWSILNDNTTLTVKKGEGLIIENKAELDSPYASQFFVADGFSFEEGKQYAVRYTVKVQGEGSIRTDVNHWGDGVADDGVAYTNGYKQYVFTYGASPVTNNGFHVIFQPGKFVGKIILEKVELFDITPKYDEMDWTDNLFTNGDVEGTDMSAFIAKVNSDKDALLLPAKSQAIKGSTQVVVETAAREADPDNEGKYLGNDHDTQFFVRLPYALPKGTLYYFSVDYLSNKVADVASQTHAEPGEWKSNNGVGTISTSSTAQTLEGYFSAADDMRSIAFNLASAVEGGKFFFDNFVFKVVATADDQTDLDDIKAFTQTWDETSKWNETLALNVAYDNGRNAETEGCTAESVKALDDAMAAGKAILQPAEGAEPATKDAIAAAAKAIEDAIAGLEKGKPELAYTDLTKEMFFHWNAADETAEALEASNCDYNIGTSTGQPYGLSTVNHDRFADLSAYNTIELTATEGEPRLLFNRIENEGTVFAEVPRDKDKYETVVDNGDGSKTYIINIEAIVAEYGFAHLHAIKGANWSNTTVTEIKLGYAGEKPELPIPTAIEGVETEGESIADGKYIENGQIVIVKGGKKYTVAGVEIK